MPYGHDIGQADDHVHLDLGYITLVPREISEDRSRRRRSRPRFAFEERRAGDRRGWPPDDGPHRSSRSTRGPKPE